MTDRLVQQDGRVATVVFTRLRTRNATAQAMWDVTLQSEDDREGTRAVLEKRPPRLQGR